MVLLWLLPSVVVTAAAIAWVSWYSRESREEVDRDEQLRRLGAALDPAPSRRSERVQPGYVAPPVSDDDRPRVTVRRPVQSQAKPDSTEDRKAS